MSAELISYPKLSDRLTAFCEASADFMVRSAPQWILGYFELDQKLPSKYGWRFTDDDAFRRQSSGLEGSDNINRVFWTDQARNVEAYSVMTMWRSSELLKPAIHSLNVGEIITPAVLARSLVELSTAFLLHANTIEKLFSQLTFPPNTIVTSKEFEERVIKMIWGTRLGTPKPHLAQTNVLTMIQKVAKNPNAADLLPHYEFLCEIAHPNVVGNSRYWSHIEQINADGSESRSLARSANGDHAEQIRTKVIWSLAWSAGSLCNAFSMISNSLKELLSKLQGS